MSSNRGAKAAVAHAHKVLASIAGLRQSVPPPETFRQAKFDNDEVAVPMLRLLHDVLVLDTLDVLDFENGSDSRASDHIRAILDDAWMKWFNSPSDKPRDELDHTLHLGLVKYLLKNLKLSRESFDGMSSDFLSSRELLLALGWTMAQRNLLERWVVAQLKVDSIGSSDGSGDIHIHDEIDVEPIVSDKINRSLNRRKSQWDQIGEDIMSNAAGSDQLVPSSDLLKQIVNTASQTQWTLRMLACNQIGRTRTLHRLRETTSTTASDSSFPTLSPFQPGPSPYASVGNCTGHTSNKTSKTVKKSASSVKSTKSPVSRRHLSMFEVALLCDPIKLSRYQNNLDRAVQKANQGLHAFTDQQPTWWHWLNSICSSSVEMDSTTLQHQVPAARKYLDLEQKTPVFRLFESEKYEPGPKRDALQQSHLKTNQWKDELHHLRTEMSTIREQISQQNSSLLQILSAKVADLVLVE